MNFLNYLRRWNVLLVLSIVVPLVFLTTFKLVDILREPINLSLAPRVMAEPVKYEFERPRHWIDLEKLIVNTYSDEGISATMCVLATDCKPPVGFLINVSASVPSHNYIVKLHVVFEEEYERSIIDERGKLFECFWQNLSLVRCEDYIEGAGVKCYIELSNVNRSKSIFFETFVKWLLRSNVNQTHHLTISAEVAYWNGSDFVWVVLPIEIIIFPDIRFDGQIFSPGTYPWLYIGGYDENDYYKIYLEKDHNVQIYLEETSSDKANINIYVYDPNGIEKAYKTLYRWLGPPYTNLTLITDKTGYWCIQIELRGGQCFYTLKINTAG